MKLHHALMIAALSATSISSFAATKNHHNTAAQDSTAQPTMVSTADAPAQPASAEVPASTDTATPVVQ